MSRPRNITEAGRVRLLQVAIARRRLPSDKDLAREFRVSVRAIHYHMRELLRDMEVSCETNAGNIAQHDETR